VIADAGRTTTRPVVFRTVGFRGAGYRFTLEMPAMAAGARERAGAAKAALGWRWRNPRRLSMGFAPKIRFAPDSPLEGDGFEPSVPGTKEPVFVAEGELRDRTGEPKGLFLMRYR
jgi:hypothetical protein